jgi:toxin secretion/phage lysis holin
MSWILLKLKYSWLKVCISFPLGVFVLTDQHFAVIYALLMMIMIDTVLGVWVAIKFKKFASHRLGRMANKMARYSLALASVWIVACLNPALFGWMFASFGTFFILTELFSNFEKLSLLDMKMPTHLLAKVNRDFQRIQENNGKKKESIKKILDKE